MTLMVNPKRAAIVKASIVQAMKFRQTIDEGVWVSPLSKYTADPIGFITEHLHEHLWSKQRDIAQAVVEHRRVAVPTAHDLGKSYLAARIVAWWLSCHAPGEAFAVTTATTGAQVRAILWREIGRAHAKGKLPGRTNQTEWWIGSEMVGFGRKPSDYDPTAFQGIHARYVLVVIDEACGVPESIWRAAGTLATNENARMLAIGNPDDPGSYFGTTVCAPASGWHVLPVSAFDSPNFTGEEVPEALTELLLGRTYEQELLAEVGADSPVYISKILGRFPEDINEGVVPLSWVRKCQRIEALPGTPVSLGMDVGAGGDETVLRERRGMVAGRTWRKKTPNWVDGVSLALEAIDLVDPDYMNIDSIGIGWGVHGRLRELKDQGRLRVDVRAVNVGEASRQPDKYPKLRDQIWWEVGRELSRDGGWDLGAVDDVTVAQLIAPLYARDSSNRIQVEKKADTKKRLRRSPDDADALLLAYYDAGGIGVWSM